MPQDPRLRSRQAEEEDIQRLRMQRLFGSDNAAGIKPDLHKQKAHEFEESHPWLQAIGDFLSGGATNTDFQPGPADVLTAALPMAVPRHLHDVIMRGLRGPSGYGLKEGFSPEFERLLSRWTGGSAMYNPETNIEFANMLRQFRDKDAKLVQSHLQETLGTDTIPLFRGVKRDELVDLMEHYQAGTDPGIRSFTLEPRISHQFADPNIRISNDPENMKLRPTKGLIYKADTPINHILGVGEIPYQKEIIIDMKGLDPTKLRRLRSNPLEY